METILTAPDTLSVNDGISQELCSLEYTKISAVVTELNKMGPGTLLTKIDIKSTYRIIPVHPVDRHLLGMSRKGGIYVDTALSFGPPNFQCCSGHFGVDTAADTTKGEIRLPEEKLQ